MIHARPGVHGIRAVGRAISDFFVPRGCLVCGLIAPQWRAPVCEHCLAKLELLRIPGDARHMLRTALAVSDSIDSVFGLFAYAEEGIIRVLVHAMKYRGSQSLCRRYGAEIGIALRGEGTAGGVDVLVPVPLHPARLRERRYNQSERLAEGIAAETRCPIDMKMLERVRKTPPQAFLGSVERSENIKSAFAMTRKLERGMRVGLVDDVVTTGATVSACAALMKKAGASRVVVLCAAVARTDHLLADAAEES